MRQAWHVHGFLLTAYGQQTLWVGRSDSPERRLPEHLSDYERSRRMPDRRPELAPEFHEHLDPFARRSDAQRAADWLAADLRAAGYTLLARLGRSREESRDGSREPRATASLSCWLPTPSAQLTDGSRE